MKEISGNVIYGMYKVKVHRSHISSKRAKSRGWRRRLKIRLEHKVKRNQYKRRKNGEQRVPTKKGD